MVSPYFETANQFLSMQNDPNRHPSQNRGICNLRFRFRFCKCPSFGLRRLDSPNRVSSLFALRNLAPWPWNLQYSWGLRPSVSGTRRDFFLCGTLVGQGAHEGLPIGSALAITTQPGLYIAVLLGTPEEVERACKHAASTQHIVGICSQTGCVQYCFFCGQNANKN